MAGKCYIIGINFKADKVFGLSGYEFIPAVSETETAEEAIARYIEECKEDGLPLNEKELKGIGEIPEEYFEAVAMQITGETSTVFNNIPYAKIDEKRFWQWDLDEEEIRNGYMAVRYTIA